MAGDAIADPLTGLAAALAAWAAWRSGRGALLDLALARTVAHCLTALPHAKDVRRWQAIAIAMASDAPLYPLREAGRPARAIGADDPAQIWPC